MSFEEWKRRSSETIIQSGGKLITGGKRYNVNEESSQKDIAATMAYKKICRRNDVKVIAQNSGFSEAEIQQIKRHVFYEKHKTYNGYQILDPDYDMAVAWNRLYNGSQVDRDILLLRHELLESQVEKEYNLSLADAHARATLKYNWAAKLDEELGEEGEPYGLL